MQRELLRAMSRNLVSYGTMVLNTEVYKKTSSHYSSAVPDWSLVCGKPLQLQPLWTSLPCRRAGIGPGFGGVWLYYIFTAVFQIMLQWWVWIQLVLCLWVCWCCPVWALGLLWLGEAVARVRDMSTILPLFYQILKPLPADGYDLWEPFLRSH